MGGAEWGRGSQKWWDICHCVGGREQLFYSCKGEVQNLQHGKVRMCVVDRAPEMAGHPPSRGETAKSVLLL